MADFNAEAYLHTIEAALLKVADPSTAVAQKAYMRSQFEYFGIKSPVRREAVKPFLIKSALPPLEHVEDLVKKLWTKPQREFQYVAMDLLAKYKRNHALQLPLFEYLIINKSWWDTVDYIAASLVGNALKHRSSDQWEYAEKWLDSGNLWLQRTAILFQLKYKEDLDRALLDHVIGNLLGSKEFFINKAIGWVLREFSKRDPNWVVEYVEKTALSPLSRREALKRIAPHQ